MIAHFEKALELSELIPLAYELDAPLSAMRTRTVDRSRTRARGQTDEHQGRQEHDPDIALAAIKPDIDFCEGTQLTQHVVEAMRVTGTPHLLYASGSGVYGDLGELEIAEDHGPLLPVSRQPKPSGH